jgi:hypothetical protein
MMDTTQRQSAITSLAIHALAVIALFGLVTTQTPMIRVPRQVAIHAPLLKPYASRQGGGGAHADTPVSKGRLPPRSVRVFVPPMLTPMNLTPKLVTAASFDLPPDISSATHLGDPNGLSSLLSGGMGGPTGIGDGNGKRVGSGNGGTGAGPRAFTKLGTASRCRW